MRDDPDLSFERRLWRSGLRSVAGLDEAGRGALAGPVAVGAVILPGGARRGGNSLPELLRGVRDSKQMTPAGREEAAPRIKTTAVAWAVGFASAQEIDADGIVAATRLAAMRALAELGLYPDYLLTDFRLELPELDIPQTALVKGDAHCLSIAAASVLAKTARDALLCEMDAQVPGYGLARHKGYGTRSHLLALQCQGYSPVHRKSFTIKSNAKSVDTF
ncbi:MAG TPA: ribonuclease HII [Anaerolineae bacterium]